MEQALALDGDVEGLQANQEELPDPSAMRAPCPQKPPCLNEVRSAVGKIARDDAVDMLDPSEQGSRRGRGRGIVKGCKAGAKGMGKGKGRGKCKSKGSPKCKKGGATFATKAVAGLAKKRAAKPKLQDTCYKLPPLAYDETGKLMLPDELPEQARPLPDQDRGAHSYTVRGVNIDGKPNACRIEVHLRLQKLFVAKVHDNCERELKNNGHYTWNSNSEIPRNIRWEWFAYLQEAWDWTTEVTMFHGLAP